MKAVINIVALLSGLANNSSYAHAYELRGGTVALTGTADGLLLPQVSSGVTVSADAADDHARGEKCLHNTQYWLNHKTWCINHGYRYSSCRKLNCEEDKVYYENHESCCDDHGWPYGNTSCRKHNCEEDKEYYKNHESCCDDHGWPYDSHGPTYGKHKCEDDWDFWSENKHFCRDHGYCYGCGGSSRATTEQCNHWKIHSYEKYERLCSVLFDFLDNYKDAELIADIFAGVYEDVQDGEKFQDEDLEEVQG